MQSNDRRAPTRADASTIDPYCDELPVIKNNFRREYWAERKLAYSAFQFKKISQFGIKIQEKIVDKKLTFDSSSCLGKSQMLNDLFLQCPSIEDHRLLASVLYNSMPKVMEVFVDCLMEGEALSYVFIRTLINYSYHLPARKSMASLGAFETIFNILPCAEDETIITAMELFELLTDHFTPEIRSKLLIRNFLPRIVNMLTISTTGKTYKDIQWYLGCCLCLILRIVHHPQGKRTVEDSSVILLNCLQSIESNCPLSSEELASIKTIKYEIAILEKTNVQIQRKSCISSRQSLNNIN